MSWSNDDIMCPLDAPKLLPAAAASRSCQARDSKSAKSRIAALSPSYGRRRHSGDFFRITTVALRALVVDSSLVVLWNSIESITLQGDPVLQFWPLASSKATASVKKREEERLKRRSGYLQRDGVVMVVAA
jgi:hypothetical protein